MNERNLVFQATMTLAQFANDYAKDNNVDIIKSPKTGKYFMTNSAGQSLGACSTKVAEASTDERNQMQLVVSLVHPKDSPETPFCLLHAKGNGSEENRLFSINLKAQ